MPSNCFLATWLLLVWAALMKGAAAVSGRASYYGGNLSGGNCMLTSYTLPDGVYGTAISGANWNTSGMCGTCLNVQGPRGSVKVMVVDNCPGCAQNQLDLFQDAFAKVGDLSAGIISVTWDVVPCGITQPLKVRNKEGTSKYWFSMQAFNSNQQVKSLDVSTDGGGSWQSTARRDYNYFEKSGGGGFGVDSLTVRVTCASGAQVRLQSVGVGASTSFTASGNC